MGWWQLDATLKEQAAYKTFYDQQPPVACPFDGTPLLLGPPERSAMRYCPNGDFEYPRDWDVNSMSGM